jgi:hypothetical protein
MGTEAYVQDSMNSIPMERGGDRRMAALSANPERRSFTRRIECDGARAPEHVAPARGGGLREPDMWARQRDDHR